MAVFKNNFFVHIIREKDVRTPLLSIGENRRSLAIAVVELLSLHPPLSNSGADIRYNIQLQFLTNLHTRFDNTADIIFQYITEKTEV